jgi:hypothetical protein
LNTSMAKLPQSIQAIVPCAGALGALLVSVGAVRRAKIGIVDIYMLGYTTILLVWPYRDCRFWLPVLPLLAAYAWSALGGVARFPWARRVRIAYIAVFALMGCISLFYSSRISLAGERFPDLYGNGIYRESYRALAAAHSDGGSQSNQGDPKLIRLIERYGSGIRLARNPRPEEGAMQ